MILRRGTKARPAKALPEYLESVLGGWRRKGRRVYRICGIIEQGIAFSPCRSHTELWDVDNYIKVLGVPGPVMGFDICHPLCRPSGAPWSIGPEDRENRQKKILRMLQKGAPVGYGAVLDEEKVGKLFSDMGNPPEVACSYAAVLAYANQWDDFEELTCAFLKDCADRQRRQPSINSERVAYINALRLCHMDGVAGSWLERNAECHRELIDRGGPSSKLSSFDWASLSPP